MQNLNEHFRDEMFIAQVIYEFFINTHCRLCSCFLMTDMIWLNIKNINIIQSTVKQNDRNINSYRINRDFSNSLIVQLDISETVKIYSIFHVNFFLHETNDSLSEQRQKLRKSVIVSNEQREWYVNSILNSKIDRKFQSSLLKYFVNWERHNSTWESFYFLINCQQALNEFHVVNSNVFESHVTSCNQSRCHCHDV